MRGETGELDISAKRGFNLFMGKAACGTCHFAPIFNGTVPPKFMESEHEILGTTSTPDLKSPKLDTDLGRYNYIKANELKNSFKTPTVRNTKLTAPYMHNGAYKTLAEVIEFYNEGGGIGLGLDIPNQTLPGDKLNLTDQEKKDIIAFLELLTDNQNFSAPKQLPEFPLDAKLNKRPI
ncbi:MAG: cytochrome-c peroxidase, partial [Bacteroidia bacterium]